jgi:GNAT superfamily N-acetyltransferase
MQAGWHIRGAVPQDGEAIGQLHVQAWQETYRGLIPDEVLCGLSLQDKQEFWRRRIGEKPGQVAVLEIAGLGLGGFGDFSDTTDAVLRAPFEIGSLYLRRAVQGNGGGRALFNALMQAIRARGGRAAGLWCAAENGAARGFYVRLGGSVIGEKVQIRQSFRLPLIAYHWDLTDPQEC